ncbi:type II secretion system protein [Noviherbaspirillum galbum]|uniref:Prepilin-type N-terminal cleavage/methylation domain-containing protein n=1 Tax=Noviherbaspirillum galbum TaxID=2709383 RepID=A0A6B3SZ08_9BURK|nr:type II secretion system protein [Noviherbaspirillum galbum]NEX64222.1 prepilin-type N-terminal cleavage/methylation domain-containing protein [Noviherbaspirillum galbum]
MMPTRRHSGFTLIELAIVLIIGTLVTAAGFLYKAEQVRSEQRAVIAGQMQLLAEALQNYMVMNMASLYTLNGTLDVKAKKDFLSGRFGANASDVVASFGMATNFFPLYPSYQELSQMGWLPSGAPSSHPMVGDYVFRISPGTNFPACVASKSCRFVAVVYGSKPLVRSSGTSVGAVDEVGIGEVLQRSSSTVLIGYTKGGKLLARDGITVTDTNPLDGAALMSVIPSTVDGILSATSTYDTSPWYAYLRRDGSLPMQGDLNMQDAAGTHAINNASSVNAKNMNASIIDTERAYVGVTDSYGQHVTYTNIASTKVIDQKQSLIVGNGAAIFGPAPGTSNGDSMALRVSKYSDGTGGAATIDGRLVANNGITVPGGNIDVFTGNITTYGTNLGQGAISASNGVNIGQGGARINGNVQVLNGDVQVAGGNVVVSDPKKGVVTTNLTAQQSTLYVWRFGASGPTPCTVVLNRFEVQGSSLSSSDVAGLAPDGFYGPVSKNPGLYSPTGIYYLGCSR